MAENFIVKIIVAAVFTAGSVGFMPTVTARSITSSRINFFRSDSLTNPLDTLSPDLQQTAQKIEAQKSKLTTRIDSLNRLGLPTDKYSRKLDSLKSIDPLSVFNKQQEKLAGVQSNAETILDKPKDKIEENINKLSSNKATDSLGNMQSKAHAVLDKPKDMIDEKVSQLTNNKATDQLNGVQTKADGILNKPEEKVNEKLNLLSKEAGGEGNLSGNMNVPGLEGKTALPGLDKRITGNLSDVKADIPSLPKADNPLNKNLGDLKSEMPGVDKPAMPDLKTDNPLGDKLNVKKQIDKVKETFEAKDIQKGMGDVTEASGKASGYAKDVERISKGELDKTETIKKDVMERTPEEVGALKKEIDAAEAQKDKLKSYHNPEEFKKQTLARSREMVAKQFAAQQTQINGTVLKVSEYQKRSESLIKNVKGLPKRPRKEKRPPLIERFVPGFNFQIQKTESWLVDLNPSLRFRVRSIFSVGAGWNERLAIDQHGKFNSTERAYGPRAFSELTIRRGLSVRADAERVHAFVPVARLQPDVRESQWVWSYMAGIKKEFSFTRGVIGNVQFMYNLYNPEHRSPYASRLNVRFGFEFPIRKKKSKKSDVKPD